MGFSNLLLTWLVLSHLLLYSDVILTNQLFCTVAKLSPGSKMPVASHKGTRKHYFGIIQKFIVHSSNPRLHTAM